MPRPAQPQRKTTPNRRATRPNKAQLRAAQVRAEQTAAQATIPDGSTALLDDVSDRPFEIDVADTPVTPVSRPAIATRATPPRSARSASRQASRAALPRVKTLSREQEFAFIRADMRRLLVTAGAIFAVMLVLLFFIEH